MCINHPESVLTTMESWSQKHHNEVCIKCPFSFVIDGAKNFVSKYTYIKFHNLHVVFLFL